MKKTSLLAIMAGVALAGCVKNEPVAKSDGSPERITFAAPVVSVPTRATEILNPYPTNQKFKVYARYHVGNFKKFSETEAYFDDECAHDATLDCWKPKTDRYWPKTTNAKLTFAAYSPSSVTGTYGQSGFTFADFAVTEASADQIDLLYSGRVYDQTKDNMLTSENKNPYTGTTIPFEHALSSIIFKAKAGTDVTDNAIKLTSIVIQNVYSKGTFKQGLADNKDNDNDDPTWSAFKDVKTYTVYDKGNTNGVSLTSSEVFVNGVTTISDGKQRSDLILIPQSLGTVSADDTAGTVAKDATKVVIKYKAGSDVEQTSEFTLSGTWDISKRYTYSITIALDKIYFNPTVTGWTEATGTATENNTGNK